MRPEGSCALGRIAVVDVIFSWRDNLVRFTIRAHAAPLLGASLILLTRRAAVRGRLGAADAGLDHGPVSVVSPVSGTHALWAIVFSALAFGRAEAVGSRIVLSGVVSVSAVILIGVAR